jgi:hypothetical protein
MTQWMLNGRLSHAKHLITGGEGKLSSFMN